jgi:membrane-associated protein
MDLIRTAIDFFLHLDKHLAEIIANYGVWTNLILFLIVFAETGLVDTPFLPGDSMLFAAGTFAALGSLDPVLLILLLSAAAILGVTVNYWVGAYIGPRAFSGEVRWLRKEYLDRTHAFYEKHGGKTIILARFIPIIRTFAPFVAGVGTMTYSRFLLYNVVGGVVWVTLFVLAGYYFGNLPAVRQNFSYVILAIIMLSVMPIVVEFMKSRRRAGA